MATTTNYSWTTPNDSDPFRNGASAMRTLGSSVDTTLFTALGGAYPGLRLVKKQTIGSGVPSVTVTGAFSATYENYKILVTGGVGSASSSSLRLTLGGITTGYYTAMSYVNFSGGATVAAVNIPGAAYWEWAGSGTTSGLYADLDLQNPFASKIKVGTGTYIETLHAGVGGKANFLNLSTSSATEFTMTAGSGTLTGGTIYVYGYGAS
jgi:hypothetical protein